MICHLLTSMRRVSPAVWNLIAIAVIAGSAALIAYHAGFDHGYAYAYRWKWSVVP